MKTSKVTTTVMQLQYVRVTTTYEVETNLLNKSLKNQHGNLEDAVNELLWHEELSRVNETSELEELVNTTDKYGTLNKMTCQLIGHCETSEYHPMQLLRMKHGILIRETIVHKNVDTIDPYITKLVQRLEKKGFFVEHGYDNNWHCYWIILNTGDNCWKIFPNKPVHEWPL